MTIVRIEIPGAAIPWKAPRVVQRAGSPYPIAIKDSKLRHWQETVMGRAMEAMAGRPPIKGPVQLAVLYFRRIPKSWPKWKRRDAEAGIVRPTARPDLDNLIKGAKDALQGVCFLDDAQVVQYGSASLGDVVLATGKYFTTDEPRLLLEVRELEPTALAT